MINFNRKILLMVKFNLREMQFSFMLDNMYNNAGENRRGNQELAIQRHQQHWAHKTQDEDKQNTKNTKQKT